MRKIDPSAVEAVAKPLFWRKADDHPQEWVGELVAFGLGGRYSIRKDDYGVHVWWPEDEFTFTTYPDMATAKAEAEKHWQAEFAERIAAMPANPSDQEKLVAELVEALEKARAALACWRCGGTGNVTTVLGDLDECPACHGDEIPTLLMTEIDALLTRARQTGDEV